MSAPARLWVCPMCFSTRVQSQAWVDSNTGRVFDDTGGYNWCSECSDAGRDGETKYLWQVSRDADGRWSCADGEIPDDVLAARADEWAWLVLFSSRF